MDVMPDPPKRKRPAPKKPIIPVPHAVKGKPTGEKMRPVAPKPKPVPVQPDSSKMRQPKMAEVATEPKRKAKQG